MARGAHEGEKPISRAMVVRLNYFAVSRYLLVAARIVFPPRKNHAHGSDDGL